MNQRIAACVCMAFAAVAAMPDTLAAQDNPMKIKPGLIDQCLDGKEGHARLQCVGLAADDCQISNEGGGSTVGAGFCFGAERDWWDAKLNDAYKQLVVLDTANDEEYRDMQSVPKKLPALKAMQRAWITYRDGLCEYEYVQWGGGTGAGPASSACEMMETARQYFVLADRLEE